MFTRGGMGLNVKKVSITTRIREMGWPHIREYLSTSSKVGSMYSTSPSTTTALHRL